MTAAGKSTRFYLPLPADEHGNIGFPPVVIEATTDPEPDALGSPCLRVIAPARFAWRTVRKGAGGYGSWAEVEGPARMLTRAEYDSIIATMNVERE